MRNLSNLFKVVGMTFRPLPEGSFIKIMDQYETDDGTPVALARVIIQPEPTNEFDPDAVAIIAELTTGQPFVVGYIGKDDPWKHKITRPVIATMRIVDYSAKSSYNPSYNIINVEME